MLSTFVLLRWGSSWSWLVVWHLSWRVHKICSWVEMCVCLPGLQWCSSNYTLSPNSYWICGFYWNWMFNTVIKFLVFLYTYLFCFSFENMNLKLNLFLRDEIKLVQLNYFFQPKCISFHSSSQCVWQALRHAPLICW